MKRPFEILMIWLCFLSASRLAADDWTRFRGPGGSGSSQQTGLPLTWSETENIVWRAALPGYGASSPVTSGGRIFLTGYSGYGTDQTDSAAKADLVQHVFSLDRADGRLLWDRTSPANDEEQDYKSYIALHGYASHTPVTDGRAVFAFFGSSGVVAYDVAGDHLWTAKVGAGTHGFGTASSPVLYDDLVIINASVESGSVVALSKTTGKEVWRAGGIQSAWNTPVLVSVKDGEKELVIHCQGQILGFDPVTGKQLWNYQTGKGSYICPSVVAVDGVVYAICGRDGKVVAVRAGGRGDVTETREVWSSQGSSNVPSPVFHGGYLYWISDTGIAHCLDAALGASVYQKRLGNTDRVYASVVSADGRLYAVTRQRGTFVLSAGPEFEQLAHNAIAGDGSIFNASPTVSNGHLLLRSDKYLYCIGQSR